jgi:uncharacterized protein (TIGR02246 family)
MLVTEARMMRSLALFAVLALSQAAFAQAPSSEDRTSIDALVADLDRAWAEQDADRWAAHYLPDAEFINILGRVMPDAKAMRARHHEIFTGVFAGSRHHGTLRSLRLLTADVAVADVDIEVTGFRALPPGARETAPGVLRTRMRHVLKKIDGRWWIAATQNTAVAPAP